MTISDIPYLACLLGGFVVAGFVIATVVTAFFNLWDAGPGRYKPGPRVEFRVLDQGKDECGNPVAIVQANNSREASRMTDGTTYAGGHWVLRRTGDKEFTVFGTTENFMVPPTPKIVKR